MINFGFFKIVFYYLTNIFRCLLGTFFSHRKLHKALWFRPFNMVSHTTRMHLQHKVLFRLWTICLLRKPLPHHPIISPHRITYIEDHLSPWIHNVCIVVRNIWMLSYAELGKLTWILRFYRTTNKRRPTAEPAVSRWISATRSAPVVRQ